jgi:hypothetical protein
MGSSRISCWMIRGQEGTDKMQFLHCCSIINFFVRRREPLPSPARGLGTLLRAGHTVEQIVLVERVRRPDPDSARRCSAVAGAGTPEVEPGLRVGSPAGPGAMVGPFGSGERTETVPAGRFPGYPDGNTRVTRGADTGSERNGRQLLCQKQPSRRHGIDVDRAHLRLAVPRTSGFEEANLANI